MALLENTKLVLIKKIFVAVHFLKVFTDGRIVFGNGSMKVSGCITNIICIAQITYKFINNAVLTYNTRPNFLRLKISKIGCKVTADCISGYLIFKGKNYSDCVAKKKLCSAERHVPQFKITQWKN